MALYKKKTVVVEAFRFGYDEYPPWFSENDYSTMFNNGNGKIFLLNTLEGKMSFRKGDMIIKGVIGEIYPCNKDIFDKSYDKIEEGRPFIYPVLTAEEIKSS